MTGTFPPDLLTSYISIFRNDYDIIVVHWDMTYLLTFVDKTKSEKYNECRVLLKKSEHRDPGESFLN